MVAVAKGKVLDTPLRLLEGYCFKLLHSHCSFAAIYLNFFAYELVNQIL